MIRLVQIENPKWTNAHVDHVEKYSIEYNLDLAKFEIQDKRREISQGNPGVRVYTGRDVIVYEMRSEHEALLG